MLWFYNIQCFGDFASKRSTGMIGLDYLFPNMSHAKIDEIVHFIYFQGFIIYVYVYLCKPVHAYVNHICAGALGSQKRTPNLLELRL